MKDANAERDLGREAEALVTAESAVMRKIRLGGVGLAVIGTAAALFLSESTRWSRPFFYQALLSAAGATASGSSQIRIVSVEDRFLAQALQDVAEARPGVVVLDPALWKGTDTPARHLDVFAGLKVVLGFFAEPDRAGLFNSPVPMPRYSTLEGMLSSEALPKLRLRDIDIPAEWPAHVTVGFVDRPGNRVFEAGVLARGPKGLMPSVGLEALRRGQGIAPDRIAYVDGIGLLLGPKITVPVNPTGAVALRFATAAVLSAPRLNPSELTGRIVIVASSRHIYSTVAGPKLAAEIWASQMEDALNRATPRLPSSAPWLALAVGLAGIAALALAAIYGTGIGSLAGLCAGLALLYPLAALGFFLGAGWWLPPEKPFFAILAAGIGALVAPRKNRRSAPIAKPSPSHSSSGVPRPTGSPPAAPAGANIPPQFSTRIRTQRPAERTGPAPDPGIERDAQGGLVRVGKYRILRKMGSGSAGDVFEGMDTQMSRRVAIKAMTRGAQLHFDHAMERFVVEAKAAGSLNHPNINTIYDFGTLSNVSFMVLEYLDGVTLSQWMKANPPPPPSSVQEWVKQIGSALDYAHEHRVIHRDLKPGNLMVVDGGHTIKLLDFGVAKLEDVMLTQTGMTVGTPSYMSPEQLQGEKVTAASDQYSLAVVLYQLFSHRLPYAGTRIPEICNRILKHEVIPLHDANPALAEAYWVALERAMRKDPAERYSSCLALSEAIENAGATSGPAPDPALG